MYCLFVLLKRYLASLGPTIGWGLVGIRVGNRGHCQCCEGCDFAWGIQLHTRNKHAFKRMSPMTAEIAQKGSCPIDKVFLCNQPCPSPGLPLVGNRRIVICFLRKPVFISSCNSIFLSSLSLLLKNSWRL